MRAVAVIVVLGSCAGSVRPAVIPNLTALPGDREKRDAVLESSGAQPTPEQKPTTSKMRKVETAAATAAAVIGWFFSKSSNVTLGAGAPIDENKLIDKPQPVHHESDDKDKEKDKDKDKPPTAEPPAELVPWVRLK